MIYRKKKKVISGEMEWQRALNAAQEVGLECSDDPQLCWQNRQVLFGSSKPIQAAYAQKNLSKRLLLQLLTAQP